ncbi:Pleckstrin homology domain-domain-containing protein [Naematelia encephala]|uniref:Pleckstrin homology domain-domain-containing protein n=1 Tax=Naematelia encephala TaxID=71784 RepID=A0A1Y2ADA8_9TREE|nr:Pleckstrin homology domain-domain-containing protein [Naematelia encephala]
MTSAPPHQVAIIAAEEKNDEEICPVCVESLSFTYRLPGEKPHIVPECGHALHEECFVTVYGDVPREGSRKNLGVCGVCRQPMRISDSGEGRRKGGNKLATLTGQSSGGPNRLALHQTPSEPSIRSHPSLRVPNSPSVDPTLDDPLETASGMSTSSSSRSLSFDSLPPKVVVPSISIRSEHTSITRGGRRGKQTITAMVTVEVSSAGDRGKYPAKIHEMPASRRTDDPNSPQFPPSPRSASSNNPTELSTSHRAKSLTTPDSFAHIITDLKTRVPDYRTSGLDALGALRLFDLLSVRKGPYVREFHIYLFQEALICIAEEKKSGLRSIFSSSSSAKSDSTAHGGKGVLRLKGRVFIKHVRKVIDSSHDRELSLTITMDDESSEWFILLFKERASLEVWKTHLNGLIDDMWKTGHAPQSASKVDKLMGTGSSAPGGARSTSGGKAFSPTSAASQPSGGLGMSFGDFNSPVGSHSAGPGLSAFPLVSPPAFSADSGPGDLAYLAPLAPRHTPLDLIIVLAIPAPISGQTLPLKLKLMRASIQFTLALLGPRDRVSLVATEHGPNGAVRKTPLLNATQTSSRRRLEAFVDLLGRGKTEDNEFAVPVGPEERQDVVTAVNVGLDVVLQRKQKNPLTGFILISDISDTIKRTQMDLVAARLDAANVPVHAIGYGKSHDPSPLWMISNHTHGSYTFVKEWYDLRDSLAGVIGGLMSIAITNMKLHLNCSENEFKIVKVSGAVQAIVATGGTDVDIELKELRYGEIREILVELDLEGSEEEEGRHSREGSDESDGMPNGAHPAGSVRRGSSLRSNGINGLGLDTLSVSESNALRDVVYEDAMIDEVPVTEVDCSYHDPAVNRSVARLAHPILLTIAVLPASASPSSMPADPVIVRRRMELLTSDMITRALLIASRKNFSHAIRILKETKRIIETIEDQLHSQLRNSSTGRSKKEVQIHAALDGLNGTVADLDMVLEGLEENKELFDRDHRNYAAQQAIVLRSQKSWTSRTASERQYCTKEIKEIVHTSSEWQGRS